ncbi:hypothetical protein F4818DRAFT_347114 [Hypoxylon cercidicola]|nr:hypothetical protein F4818DRAFT_347114 [Hypoxylon cercidicola]
MHINTPRLVATATWVSLAATHVILENPKPFRFVQYGPTNPISPDGLDFPCKIPPNARLQPDGEPTAMVIGEEQFASFSGRAVHGGGSCQFSLSGPVKDGWENFEPEAQWKVIHSIEGGCPARNQRGNLEGEGLNQDKYPFKIPEGIEPGNYTFSWTWLARIGGQPEYYQNCAPITVSKKSVGRRALSRRADFPELFMANMGEVSGGCTTEEALKNQLAIAFPDPGPSVDHPEGTSNLFQQQCDGNPRARQRPGPSPSDGVSSTISTPETSRTATTHDGDSATSTTLSTISTPPVAPSPPTDPTSTPMYNTEPTQTTSPGMCTEGYLTCLEDGTHFATCTGGQLTGPQPIAPGFKCRPGQGVGLDISPA